MRVVNIGVVSRFGPGRWGEGSPSCSEEKKTKKPPRGRYLFLWSRRRYTKTASRNSSPVAYTRKKLPGSGCEERRGRVERSLRRRQKTTRESTRHDSGRASVADVAVALSPASRKKIRDPSDVEYFVRKAGKNLREAPPMERNCSRALELSTAAAETGRSVVSGRPPSCVVGEVITARVAAVARRAATRVARAVRGAFTEPCANADVFADPATLGLWRTTAHEAAAHREEAILGWILRVFTARRVW